MAIKDGFVVKNGNRSGFPAVPTASAIPYDANTNVKDKIDTKADTSAVKNEFIGTLEAWNALSTEEKKAFDTYQITDDFVGGNVIYLPTIYSTEERQVGVYVDGKPLYQKTLLSVVTDDVLATNVDALVDFRVKRHGISPNGDYIDVGDGYQVNDFVCVKLVDHTLTYQNWSSTQGAIEKTADIVTIRYTKTTDVAGSGIWTPTGDIAHHYSTDEQIVGTWIDGSTVYERTWDLGSDITLTAGQWVDMSQYITISNCDKMIDVGTGISSEGVTNVLESAYNAGYLELRHLQFNSVVRYVTLQYTKSTT